MANTMVKVWLRLGKYNIWLRKDSELRLIKKKRGDVNCRSVIGREFQSSAGKLDLLHAHPATQPPRTYFQPYYIKATPLPALAQTIYITHKS